MQPSEDSPATSPAPENATNLSPAERLLLWRRRQGLSQHAAALLLGVASAQLYKYETGRGRPSLDNAVRMEPITGIPASAWSPAPVAEVAG